MRLIVRKKLRKKKLPPRVSFADLNLSNSSKRFSINVSLTVGKKIVFPIGHRDMIEMTIDGLRYDMPWSRWYL